MEAAAFGALFLLAMFAPALFGGSVALFGDPTAVPPIKAMADSDPWMLVLALVGAAGVGALFQLGGRAIWEIAFPYGPQSGWHRVVKRDKDFRIAIAESRPPYESLGYRDDELRLAKIATGAEPAGPSAVQRSPWPYSGHEYVLPAAYYFYKDAPEAVVGWVSRRYQRFVDAISVAMAIGIGVGVGWIFLPGQDLAKQAALSIVLLVVAVLTLAWAIETRRLAQEMEAFWFALQSERAGEQAKPVHAALDRAKRLADEVEGVLAGAAH